MNILKFQQWLWLFLLGLIFLRPFLSEYAFTFWGSWYMLALLFCAALFMVLRPRQLLRGVRSNVFAFLFIVCIFFSMLFTGHTPWTVFELYLFIPNVLIFYIVSTLEPERREQIINTMLYAALLVCAYGLYQYFFGFGQTLAWLHGQGVLDRHAEDILAHRRVFATAISPNILASYVIMMLFVALGVALSVTQRIQKFFSWAAVVLMGTCLFLTKSLGGILAFLVMGMLFKLLMSRVQPHRGLSLRRFSIILISTVCFVLIVLAVFLVMDRVSDFLDLKSPNNSIVQRFYYWQASLDMARDFPLTGVGWRRFGLLYGVYKPFLANESHFSHNILLQIMVELGVLGLAVFLMLIFVFMKYSFELALRFKKREPVVLGIICSALAFLIHNMVDLSFYFGQVAFFWWIMIGLIANLKLEQTPEQPRVSRFPFGP